MAEIGIVILNYNTWDDSLRCVDSIRKNPPQVSYKIILVDNASMVPKPDRVEQMVRRKEIILIENQKNLGYNAGNNIGIKRALEMGCAGMIIANSDVCFLEGCIQSLWDYAREHPQTGIVGPKILNREGKIERSCLCRKTGIREKYLVRTRLNAVFRKSHHTYFGFDRDYNDTFPVYAVLGCCLYLTRRCAETVTPFDEYPFLYEEELILGIRMEEAGFTTVYHGAAVIEHLHGGSTKYVKAFSYAQNIRSELYYCRKYLNMKKWQVIPLYSYRVALYLARCMVSKDFRRNMINFFKMTGEELGKC